MTCVNLQFQDAGTVCLLGDSTLALDEEMLQVLEAVDPVRPAADNVRPTAASMGARRGSPSSSVFDGDCERPGWRVNCKDLAKRILFGEDSGEADQARNGPPSIQPPPPSTSTNAPSCQDRQIRLQVGGSNK